MATIQSLEAVANITATIGEVMERLHDLDWRLSRPASVAKTDEAFGTDNQSVGRALDPRVIKHSSLRITHDTDLVY